MCMRLVMECDCREGRTQEEAFAAALAVADLAESSGIDGVWLACGVGSWGSRGGSVRVWAVTSR